MSTRLLLSEHALTAKLFDMPKKRNGCNGKVRHASREAAVTALRRMKNAGLSAYRCGICKAWHLGRSTGASRDWKFQRRLDQLLSRED